MTPNHGSKSIENGTIAEMLFDVACVRAGWNVAIPLAATGLRWDRIIERDGKISRVQIKGFSEESKQRRVQIRKSGQAFYERGDFDELAIVCCDTGHVWMLKWSDIEGMASVYIDNLGKPMLHPTDGWCNNYHHPAEW